jgi:hypothetical protein
MNYQILPLKILDILLLIFLLIGLIDFFKMLQNQSRNFLKYTSWNTSLGCSYSHIVSLRSLRPVYFSILYHFDHFVQFIFSKNILRRFRRFPILQYDLSFLFMTQLIIIGMLEQILIFDWFLYLFIVIFTNIFWFKKFVRFSNQKIERNWIYS